MSTWRVQKRALAYGAQDQLPASVGMPAGAHVAPDSNPSGFCVQLSVRTGFDISAYDFHAPPGAAWSGKTEPCLAIVVLLEGSGHGSVEQANGALVPYRPRTTYISLSRVSTQGKSVVPKGGPFRLVEMRFTLDYLERLGTLDLFDSADKRHPMSFVSTPALWIGLAPASQEMERDARVILAEAASNNAQDLLIEASALNILTSAMTLMRESGARPGATDYVTRDAPKLTKAKELMLADLAEPWRVGDIAERVGLHEKRLKTGFKIKFGQPVYKFLQSARLQTARRLLAETNSAIIDIALTVGYDSPSHFSALFRREFGLTPSAARQCAQGTLVPEPAQ